MEEVVLGICPFCGEEIVANKINTTYLEKLEEWYFGHYCCYDSNGTHNVSIVVTGKTKEEVILRCKASLRRKEDIYA